MPQSDHPLARLLLGSALGRHPPVDGAVELVPAWRDGVEAVVAFTGHAVVAGDVALAPLLAAGADGYGGAHHPAVLTALAGNGEIGCLDSVLVGRGRGGNARLVDRPDLAGHPRVVHATHWRDDVRVLGDRPGAPGRGLVTLSRGIAGLAELSIEVTAPGHGLGGPLLDDALAAVAFGDPVWACVSPGNVASLRLFLAHGFAPVAGVVLVRPDRPRRSGPRGADRADRVTGRATCEGVTASACRDGVGGGRGVGAGTEGVDRPRASVDVERGESAGRG